MSRGGDAPPLSAAGRQELIELCRRVKAALVAKFRGCCTVALSATATARLERWIESPQDQPDLVALSNALSGRSDCPS